MSQDELYRFLKIWSRKTTVSFEILKIRFLRSFLVFLDGCFSQKNPTWILQILIRSNPSLEHCPFIATYYRVTTVNRDFVSLFAGFCIGQGNTSWATL